MMPSSLRALQQIIWICILGHRLRVRVNPKSYRIIANFQEGIVDGVSIINTTKSLLNI
jgi:hypothetical protein